MLKSVSNRRRFITLAAPALGAILLAGCKVIPKAPIDTPPPPEQGPTSSLPTDSARHRVALLVPLAGPNGGVGQSIANAATMALLDTNAQNLRITTYDTSAGVASVTAQAVADGNRLILGPLLSDDIPAVAATARAARVPVISFSNDEGAAGRDVFIMGSVPSASIARTVEFAKSRGVNRYAALVPSGEYGERASAALFASVRAAGGSVAATESYDRSNTSVVSAARRLKTKGGYDAVLIADGGRFASQAAAQLKTAGAASPRLLGTDLWSGETVVATTPSLRGAWFASVSDARFRQFSASYKTRFGAQPYRIATLGYDAVLLTLRIARDWRTGSPFPMTRLTDAGGFIGLDGAFRFRPSGVVERALEVREVQAAGVVPVSPAPARFGE
ncbi:penicillin-binding protein activator [Novosphingobium sp. PS1R-30]|uniref:Penicillin-binding protein activator n=1 Tax=Novosphingobium anseongense TaxID=3133436 RepID=A0ABU8RS65_9SPHN|nr:MAG: penicillin-binding protein activator [Novosphingobium sp.]